VGNKVPENMVAAEERLELLPTPKSSQFGNSWRLWRLRYPQVQGKLAPTRVLTANQKWLVSHVKMT
jgi:hypothetical protein